MKSSPDIGNRTTPIRIIARSDRNKIMETKRVSSTGCDPVHCDVILRAITREYEKKKIFFRYSSCDGEDRTRVWLRTTIDFFCPRREKGVSVAFEKKKKKEYHRCKYARRHVRLYGIFVVLVYQQYATPNREGEVLCFFCYQTNYTIILGVQSNITLHTA